MEFTNKDVSQIQNLITAFKRAKMELEGVEVIAMAEAYRWLSNLLKTAEAEAAAPATQAVPATAPEPVAATRPTRSSRRRS